MGRIGSWAVIGGMAVLAFCMSAAPASAQDRQPWGFFAKVMGKKFVSAASEKYYSQCEFKMEDMPVLLCENSWDNNPMRTVFSEDGAMTYTYKGESSTSKVEYFEKGLITSTNKSLQFWWIDPEGHISVSGRSVSVDGGGYAYTSSRYIQANPYDILAAVNLSKRYSGVYLPNDPARAPTQALVERIIANMPVFLGAKVDPRAIAAAAPPPPAVPPESVAQPFKTGTPAAPVSTGPRLALVIGNAAYGAAMGNLPNPVRDAQLLASTLRASGFTVEVVLNADQRTMKAAISRLGQRLSAAGRKATGLFFYAGHGLQSRGANYLIPIGAQISSEVDVDLEAVPADAVLSQIGQANISTSIVILDACRNVPLFRSFRSADRGLARMDAPNGSYIAYSTAPGQTASDGSGTNSPFALALSSEMRRPGQPIETTFRNVRNSVFQSTGGKQTPWDSSSLFNSFYFTPPAK